MGDPSHEQLAEWFQEARPRLNALALRMLGSSAEAEDAVQEAWLRLAKVDAASIENIGGWLTTVVARVCLDLLRRRKVRHEELLDEEDLALPEKEGFGSPERDALLAESVGQAMFLVLDRLAPAERVAFVLHDLFDLPFADVAEVLERTEENVRKLASRGRKRLQGAREEGLSGAKDRRELVEAFLLASREGDLSALLRILDPQVVLRADLFAVKSSEANQAIHAPRLAPEILGAQAVAETFKGKARGARLVTVDGGLEAAWVHEGEVRSLFLFGLKAGRIVDIRIVMDGGALSRHRIEVIPEGAAN